MSSQMEFPKDIPSMNILTLMNDADNKIWSGPFTFIQGADTQFGLIDRYLLKKPEPNWDKEIKLTRDAVAKINTLRPKPKFFVICGDMLDAYPYEGEQSSIRKRQYADFKEIMMELDREIKLVCVCGNHDIGDVPTPETLSVYRSQFGPDYFNFWVGGVKFIVLNSQFFKAPHNVEIEAKKQEQFMKTIADPSAKHIVVFQHIPFFAENLDEEESYFNIGKQNRTRLLRDLKTAGVRYIFCGHYHKNALTNYEEMEQIVTSAIGAQLGNDQSGFRIVNVTADSLTHKYVDLYP